MSLIRGLSVCRRRGGIYLCLCLLFSSLVLISCSSLFGVSGGSSTPAIPAPAQVPLAKLKWCGKPFIVFRDEHATPTVTATAAATASAGTPTATATAGSSPTATPTLAATPTPTTLTDWSQIKSSLGFTVYLPAILPAGTCLVSASGTVHDPIFGGSFTIGYLLPDHSPISLSEAPKTAASLAFQCSPTSSPGTPVAGAGQSTPAAHSSPGGSGYQICTGVKGETNIVFSARGSTATLKQFYNALQPDVNWVPA